MTFWLLKTVLRDNWHLAALLAGVLAVGGYLQYLNGQAAATPTATSATPEAVNEAVSLESSAPDRASPQERARTIISEHKARLNAEPTAPDAPALLKAMGNLYRQKLGDYPNAIQCYELLLHDYPDWEGTRTTLIQLATCYEHVNDPDSLRRVYGEMMRRFPPESQEHQYAKAQLGE